MGTLPQESNPEKRTQGPKGPRRLPRTDGSGHRGSWLRVLWRTLAVLAGLLVVLVAAAVIFVHTATFDRLLRSEVEKRATAAVGTPVRVDGVTIQWSFRNPGAEVSGLEVAGAAPYSSPPLLRARRLGVTVHVSSWIHQEFTVASIRVEDPVAHIFMGPNGATNLPSGRPGGGAQTGIFNFNLGQVRIANGVVEFNNRQIPLTADLRDLHLNSSYSPAEKQYAGTAGFRDGRLGLGPGRSLPGSLEVSFQANPSGVTLDTVTIRSRGSEVEAEGSLRDYGRPRVKAAYVATLDGSELRKSLAIPTLPSGKVSLSGTVEYQGRGRQGPLSAVRVEGKLASPALRVEAAGRRLAVTHLMADYTVAGGVLRVPDLRAGVLGGTVEGALEVRDLGGAQAGTARLRAQGLGLRELFEAAGEGRPVVGAAQVTGSLNASGQASWKGAFEQAEAAATVDLAGALRQQAEVIPLRAHVVGRFAAPGELTLTRSSVRLAKTQVNLNGTVGLPAGASPRGTLRVEARSADLHELESLVAMFRAPGAGGNPLAGLGLYGAASFQGQVTGTLAAPRVTGVVTASPLRVKGTEWRRVSAQVAVDAGHLELRQGVLQAAGGGSLEISGDAALSQWALEGNSAVEAQVQARQLNLAPLLKAAGVTEPVTGWLDASVRVRGVESNPAGEGSAVLTRARVYGQPVDRVEASFAGTRQQVQARFTLAAPMGNAHGEVSYQPASGAYHLQVQAPSVALSRIEEVQARKLPVHGLVNLTAEGEGTVADPELRATLQMTHLRYAGQPVGDLQVRAAVARHVADVTMQGTVVKTPVSGKARIQLSGDFPMTAEVKTPPIELKPLLEMVDPALAAQISGQTEVRATAQGALKRPKQMTATVVIPTLKVNYGQVVKLAAPQPVRMEYRGGILTLQPTRIQGTDTSLTLRGVFPVAAPGRMALLAQGTVDLALLHAMNPDLTSSGQLVFDINSFTPQGQPGLHGEIRIVNASLSTESIPAALSRGNGVLTLTDRQLKISRFQGQVGGGTVTATGGVAYRPKIRFDLAAQGQGMRLLLPQGIRAGVGGRVTLTGTPARALLQGQVGVDSLAFTPDFELNQVVRSVVGAATLPSQTGFASVLKLDVGVQSTSGIRMVSRTLSVGGTMDLHVAGTAASPVILGRVNLTSGDIIAMGNRYVLDSGTIAFVNPEETEPVMNLSANTEVKDYRIHLQFRGTLSHLRTTFTSDPALPPSDVIHLLAFGTTSEGGTAAAPGTLGAESVIASQLSSQVTSRVEKITGISRLSVQPVLGSGYSNPGAVVTVQQRVTSSLFVTFQSDPTSIQQESVQIEYQFSPRFSINGVINQNGGFGIEIQRRHTW